MTEKVGVEPSVSAGARPGAPRTIARGGILALLCTTNFMVILDSQIVILALPSIEKSVGLSLSEGQWVLSAYLLSFGGLLLLGGRMADVLGRRRMYVVGTALFLLSSLLCGFAWAPAVLIGARVGQGISAAIMAPTALSILMNAFPEGAARNRALAFWSGIGGLGATAALLIGGLLTDLLGWEWVFFLNVPVAAVLLLAAPILLTEGRDRARARAYDPAGATAITGALVLLLYAVVRAPEVGWATMHTLAFLAGAVVLIAAFLLIERRSAAPLVPLRIFRSAAFVGGNLSMLVISMLAFGMSLMLSIYAQQVLDYSPIVFGLGTTAMTVMTLVGSYAAQRFIATVGYRWVTAAGLVLLGAGSLLLTEVSVGGSYFGDIFPGLFVFGPGMGATVSAAAAALAGVRERDAGLASGINSAAFQLGGAFGVAIVSSVAATEVLAPSDSLLSLNSAVRAGFAACVGFAVVGLVLALLLLRSPRADVTGLGQLDAR
ncbi:MFS transporter [Micromonospora sp. NPDC049559]|uniref:MFS transporter n=1 Tax=Micromonospora sp. NPDC049559 TaxID=3155923 RepID=UPI003413E56F